MTEELETSSRPGELWEVALALPLFQPLTYRLPPAWQAQAQAGVLVLAPVKGRQLPGFLLQPAAAVPPVTVRPLNKILDPVARFGPELVPLLLWLVDYYHYPLGEALQQILPGGLKPAALRLETWVTATALKPPESPPVPVRGRKNSWPRPLSPKAQALLACLTALGPLPLPQLSADFPRCRPLLKKLAEQGRVRLEQKAWEPLLWPDQALPPGELSLTLLPEQADALKALRQGLERRAFAPFLLHGVTASGKTEVYLRAASEALQQGGQVLILLPEIALTHPVALECRRRFGRRVALLHSGLSEAQRLSEWRRLQEGRADVVVGARSAVFAPLPRLKLVVVDEEHDPAYKNDGGLPYQARDVALYRGFLSAAAVVLVSATPSLGTFYRARTGKYHHLELPRRVTPQPLPLVYCVDLRKQRGRDRKIISAPLAEALEEVLAKGEQALLFLNRRGYATALFCLFCGRVFRCRHCSVALTHHHGAARLLCHYCGYSEPVAERCPQCQSTALKRYGIGTEKVEAEVRQRWPAARVARLDRDTVPHSGKALDLLQDFTAGRLDILVGTQMLTKGHHFPAVTLVGVVAADQSLFFPEYHAGERTFQLLAQVAGRAGRGEAPGRVVIQTCQPEHYVFNTIRDQDYRRFYEEEVKSREELGYPPFTRLALVRLSGSQEEEVSRRAGRLAAALNHYLHRHRKLAALVRLLGPAPASLTKLKDRHRWHLLLKSYGREPLREALQQVRRLWAAERCRTVDLSLDIDPGNLL